MKIKIMFLIVCAGLCLPSCSDFLESYSKSTFNAKTVFDNIGNVTLAMNGAYESLTYNDMWNDYMFRLMLDTDVECSNANYDGGLVDVSHFRGHPGISQLNSTWIRLYRTIERANIIIDQLPDSHLWNGEFERDARWVYAEAITMRAYCYYLLIGFWGDVPFIKESTKAGGDMYPTKENRDVIYEHLIQDLAEVQDYMPWQTDVVTTRRFTRGFAKGLRAKLALMYAGYSLRGKSENFITRRGTGERTAEKTRQYYDIARQECLDVMNSGKHRMKTPWVNIFKDLHSYQQDVQYGEIMFEVAFGRLFSGYAVAQAIGMSHSISPPEPKYGRAAGSYNLSMMYYYSFDRKDQRRDITSELYNYGNTSDMLSQQVLISANGRSFQPTKWRRSWIEPNMGGDLKEQSNTGVGWPLMRYTDLILMFAESENELNGPTQAAGEALASVRQRAFAQEDWEIKVEHYVDSVSENKDKFFNALVNERAWEFGGEFVRKFDLIRWYLFGDKKEEMNLVAEQILLTPNDPPYNWIPTTIYWKRADDGESIDIYNKDFRPASAPEDYNSATWVGNMSETNRTTFFEVLERIMNGYNKERNNYLFPIPTSVIESSRGSLNNDDWRPWDYQY